MSSEELWDNARRMVPSPLLLEVARARTEAFAQQRIVVVGDLVADNYIYGETDRVSREAPVLIVRYESAEVKLGGAANAAANVRSLGGKVTLVGLVGNDDMGRALREQLHTLDIELRGVTGKGLQTESKTRILAGGLNTRRQQMLRVDRGNRSPLPLALEVELAQHVRDAAQHAQAVLVSDYGAGVIGPTLRATLAELAAQGIPVCADSRYALAQLQGLTVCKPNEPELRALTGSSLETAADFHEAAERARALLRCQTLLVTRGQFGMALFDASNEPQYLPVHGAREAVDVTGAGDTVIATFTLALAAGATPLEAAQLANVAGACVVRKAGTATVQVDEILESLRAP